MVRTRLLVAREYFIMSMSVSTEKCTAVGIRVRLLQLYNYNIGWSI